MRRLMRAAGITTVHFVPSLLEPVLQAPGDVPTLRRVVCSGETLPPSAAAACLTQFPSATVWNMYGPTEAAVDVTSWRCTGDEQTRVPIGQPIANMQVYVVDGRGDLALEGATGELYLGGVGVGRGYWGRPAQTAERFVPDAFSGEAGARVYRTGDRVQWNRAGALEFLGRLDGQVKVRGYRIEVEEVVAALRRQPGVRDAAVWVQGTGAGAALIGAWVGTGSEAAVRAGLAATLPGYMVPSSYCWLETLPMTRNGKIDPARLPAPQLAEQPAGRAARRGTEQQLAEIWQQVLGVPRVGADDNFFDLGGHSLLLGRVHQRITAELRPDLPLITLFRYPTVAALARHLDAPAGTVRLADRDRPGSTQPNGRGAEPNGRADSSVGRAEGRDRLSRLRARR